MYGRIANEMVHVRRVVLAEFFEQMFWDQPPGSRHWIMCFIPVTRFIGVLYDVEEISFGKS
jgi:hypothetical protein